MSFNSHVDNVSLSKEQVLYIGGLHEQVTEQTLEGAFATFGEITRVILPRERSTNKQRGFGFVIYEDPEDAKEAQINMHDSELFGHTIRVSIARPNALDAAVETIADGVDDNQDDDFDEENPDFTAAATSIEWTIA